jgi:hypothetical protein
MSVRSVIELFFALVLLLVLAFIGWQTISNKNDIGQLTKDFKDLTDAVSHRSATNVIPQDLVTTREFEKAKADLAANNSVTDNRLRNLENDLAATRTKLAAFEGRLDTDSKTVGELSGHLADIDTTTAAQRAELGRIVKKDTSGTSIVTILEQTKQSPQFKEEFRSAVRAALSSDPPPPQGKLKVDNQTPDGREFEVNGKPSYLRPLEYREFSVPVGPVTTRLINFEEAKQWSLDASNNYSQTVIIEVVTRRK